MTESDTVAKVLVLIFFFNQRHDLGRLILKSIIRNFLGRTARIKFAESLSVAPKNLSLSQADPIWQDGLFQLCVQICKHFLCYKPTAEFPQKFSILSYKKKPKQESKILRNHLSTIKGPCESNHYKGKVLNR